uniref:Uncharacterized protein n=1 Tax=Rhizophagus irregularis (strain DAOM 181602 / DAOM 197198 / MUCL 43194) TaxID=747089 RepID=U9TLU6_RHIID
MEMVYMYSKKYIFFSFFLNKIRPPINSIVKIFLRYLSYLSRFFQIILSHDMYYHMID